MIFEIYSSVTGKTEIVEADVPEPVPAPPAPPTELEKLRADVDFLAAMGGVEL